MVWTLTNLSNDLKCNSFMVTYVKMEHYSIFSSPVFLLTFFFFFHLFVYVDIDYWNVDYAFFEKGMCLKLYFVFW